jgi:hypothetical protein
MPRVARDPSVPLFDFQPNPEKPELSPVSVNIYKGYLNKITEESYRESLADKRKKPILNKKDLMTKINRLIPIIKRIGDGNRQKLCGLYSAVFYAIGSKNLKKNKKMNLLVDEFRTIYNDDKYREYKAKKAEEEPAE